MMSEQANRGPYVHLLGAEFIKCRTVHDCVLQLTQLVHTQHQHSCSTPYLRHHGINKAEMSVMRYMHGHQLACSNPQYWHA